MKYYIAYERTEPFNINKAKILFECEDLSTVEQVVEEKEVPALIFSYDIERDTEYLDGRMVNHELSLVNERLVI